MTTATFRIPALRGQTPDTIDLAPQNHNEEITLSSINASLGAAGQEPVARQIATSSASVEKQVATIQAAERAVSANPALSDSQRRRQIEYLCARRMGLMKLLRRRAYMGGL